MINAWAAPQVRDLSDRDINRPPSRIGEAVVALSQRDLLYPLRETMAFGTLDPVSLHLANDWTSRAMEVLTSLEPNWDSYGGRAVDPSAADYAKRFVVPLLAQGVSAPAFVPTSDGGLSLEWHRPSIQLVIGVPRHQNADNRPTAFFADDVAGDEWQADVEQTMPRLVEALSRFLIPVE